MGRSRFQSLFLHTALMAALACLLASADGHARDAPERRIDWSDLRPAGEGRDNPVFPGLAASRAEGETLTEDLANVAVRIEGYVLPVDRQQDLVYEFLLVPWLGACSHAPQPPPNQMVHVIPSTPFRIAKAYDFVSVSGTLRPAVEKTQLFIMDGPAVLTSGYGIGRAEVERRTGPDTPPSTGNPWTFMER